MNENRLRGDAAVGDELGGDAGGHALLLRVTEAAALLSVGRTTLYKLIDQGELGVVHIGRAVRIPIAEVHAFVASQCHTRVVR